MSRHRRRRRLKARARAGKKLAHWTGQARLLGHGARRWVDDAVRHALERAGPFSNRYLDDVPPGDFDAEVLGSADALRVQAAPLERTAAFLREALRLGTEAARCSCGAPGVHCIGHTDDGIALWRCVDCYRDLVERLRRGRT